jgi:hypothetical protein
VQSTRKNKAPVALKEFNLHNEDCSCFRCKCLSIQISPKATPSRTRRVDFRPKDNNSWEKGTMKDERGMPLVHARDMSPIGVKEYSEKRHHYEQARKDLHNS